MKYSVILFFGLMLLTAACSKEEAKKDVSAEQKTDSVTVPPASAYKKSTDYRKRVAAFKALPDATVEQQVEKYEAVAPLFIEYQDIDKNPDYYSTQEKEDNRQGYLTLMDEMVGVKNKLGKNIPSITKDQEQRLNAADEAMNKLFPNVYKEDSTQVN